MALTEQAAEEFPLSISTEWQPISTAPTNRRIIVRLSALP